MAMAMMACQDDHIQEEVIDHHVDEIPSYVETSVYGVVHDENGRRLSGVQIQVGGRKSISDDHGVFNLSNVFINAKGGVVHAEKENYTNLNQLVFARRGGVHYIDLELGQYGEISTSVETQRHQDSYFEYHYSSETFLSDQEVYTGPIRFELHRIPLMDPEAAIKAPMPMLGESEDESIRFNPAELFFIEWQGDQNEVLDIAQDHEMTIHASVSSAQFDSSKPYYLYHWDVSAKKWNEKSRVYIENADYEISIDGSGWWMISSSSVIKKSQIQLRKDQSPIQFQKVDVVDAQNHLVYSSYSDDIGEVTIVSSPTDRAIINLMDWCGNVVFSETCEPGHFPNELNVPGDYYVWKSSMKSCSGLQADQSVMIIDPRGVHLPLRTNSNGEFMLLMNDCLQGDFFEMLAAYQGHNNKFNLSKTMILGGNQDSMWICENKQFGGYLKIDDIVMNIDSTLKCSVDTSELSMIFKFKSLGYDQSFEIDEITQDSIVGYAVGDMFNSGYQSYPIHFRILQIEEVGGSLIADFDGQVQFQGGLKDVSGRLNARIEFFR